MKIKTILSVVFLGLVFASSISANAYTETDEEKSGTEKVEKLSPNFGFHRKEVNPNPHEIGFYFKDYLPVARMRNHSYNFAGAGLSYAWHTPYTFQIPEVFPKWFGDYWNVGISSRFDFVTVSKNDDYIIDWWTINLHGGAFLEWVINDWIELQPSFEYGFQLDVLKSSRHANGTYLSQCLLISPTIKIKPLYTLKDNLSFDITPFWNFSFEVDGVANYFGIRLGVMYRLGDKSKNTGNSKTETQIQYVEKEVVKEVIREVPVYIEKEVVREVPVYIEKEVVREVPVYIEKTSGKETEEPVGMISETELESVYDAGVSDESENSEQGAEVYVETEADVETETEAETETESL